MFTTLHPRPILLCRLLSLKSLSPDALQLSQGLQPACQILAGLLIILTRMPTNRAFDSYSHSFSPSNALTCHNLSGPAAIIDLQLLLRPRQCQLGARTQSTTISALLRRTPVVRVTAPQNSEAKYSSLTIRVWFAVDLLRKSIEPNPAASEDASVRRVDIEQYGCDVKNSLGIARANQLLNVPLLRSTQ